MIFKLLMKKYICHVTLRLTLLIIVGTVLALSGCTPSNSEGFAVYLTEGDIPPDRMPVLSHIDIAEHPIVAINDIVTYNAQTHEIKLTANAFERVSEMEVPVRGKSLVVCVDRSPIYWGAFWTPISSISFDGIVIV